MRRSFSKAARFSVFLASLLLPAGSAFAEAISTDVGSHSVTQLRFTNVNTALDSVWWRVFQIVYLLLGVVAVLVIIGAGIQYITSAGNAEKTKKARQAIINTLLGIILLVASYAIIGFLVGIARNAAASG